MVVSTQTRHFFYNRSAIGSRRQGILHSLGRAIRSNTLGFIHMVLLRQKYTIIKRLALIVTFINKYSQLLLRSLAF